MPPPVHARRLRLPLLTAAFGVSAMSAVPAYCQSSDVLPELSALPDDAALDTLDPDAPLAPLPGIEVDWPELGAELPPLEPLPIEAAQNQLPEQPDAPVQPSEIVADDGDIPFADDPAFASVDGGIDHSIAGNREPMPGVAASGSTSDAVSPTMFDVAAEQGESRYSVRLAGIETVDDPGLQSRFDALSVLQNFRGRPANGAQINRRIMEDVELFGRILRNDGYYDASVASHLERGSGAIAIELRADLGPLYHYRSVELAGLSVAGLVEAARLRNVFIVGTGQPILADKLVAAQAALQTELLETGYPFGTVGDERIIIDHETREGDLVQAVDPGPRLRFGDIIANDGGLLGSQHMARIARFAPGAWYRHSDVEDLRRALIATGLVSSVAIEPRRSQQDAANVDLSITLAPAPLRTISGALGYGSGEGYRAEVSWEHRNLFPPEGALVLRGVAGTQEQLAAVTFRRNNIWRRDHILTAQAQASHVDRSAYDAYSFTLAGRFERASTLIFQKRWSWSVGAEIIATDERSFVVTTGSFDRRTYFISALPASVTYDRSDSLLDPTRGYRVTARLSPEISYQNGAQAYARAQLDASMYRPVSSGIIFAGRVRIASLVGAASTESIAPSRRFYAGGGGSVRGFGYQAIGARDVNNDPVGGRSLFEIAAEARIHAFGEFSIVPFVDAGNVYDAPTPAFDGLRFGAGLGVRYRSNFGPIRVDVATPINRRPGDSLIGVYVSLGQAF